MTTPKEHNIVSVSGGKDSTALLLLAIERKVENLSAVFADTGNEHPQTYEYLQYLSEATGIAIRWVKADFTKDLQRKKERLLKMISGEVPDQFGKYRMSAERAAEAIHLLEPTGNPFLDVCLVKGYFPSTRRRFCSEKLKRDPINDQVVNPILEAGEDIISWQGVRADESPARALLVERECKLIHANGAELWNYRPLLRWTAEDCFAMHRKHGIDHNPLYSQGMKRVGCMPCIHAGKDELLEISQRFPEEIARISAWEDAISGVKKIKGMTGSFFHKSDGRGDGIWEAVEWAKTSRGGKQYDLMRSDDDVEACSSIYGLCE